MFRVRVDLKFRVKLGRGVYYWLRKISSIVAIYLRDLSVRIVESMKATLSFMYYSEYDKQRHVAGDYFSGKIIKYSVKHWLQVDGGVEDYVVIYRASDLLTKKLVCLLSQITRRVVRSLIIVWSLDLVGRECIGGFFSFWFENGSWVDRGFIPTFGDFIVFTAAPMSRCVTIAT